MDHTTKLNRLRNIQRTSFSKEIQIVSKLMHHYFCQLDSPRSYTIIRMKNGNTLLSWCKNGNHKHKAYINLTSLCKKDNEHLFNVQPWESHTGSYSEFVLNSISSNRRPSGNQISETFTHAQLTEVLKHETQY